MARCDACRGYPVTVAAGRGVRIGLVPNQADALAAITRARVGRLVRSSFARNRRIIQLAGVKAG